MNRRRDADERRCSWAGDGHWPVDRLVVARGQSLCMIVGSVVGSKAGMISAICRLCCRLRGHAFGWVVPVALLAHDVEDDGFARFDVYQYQDDLRCSVCGLVSDHRSYVVRQRRRPA